MISSQGGTVRPCPSGVAAPTFLSRMTTLAASFRLAHVTLREIQLPLVRPFRTAGGVTTERRILLAELTDADGTTAWSECVAETRPSYSPDTVDTCWLALREWVLPRVLGTPFAGAHAVHELVAHGVRGHAMARAAIEMGAWALESERRGQALAATLARAAGSAPRHQVATGIVLGFHETTDALVEAARDALAHGYQRIKIKVAPGREVEEVRAVRDALGDEARLGVDANASYSLDDAHHRAALRALDAMDLAMIEQPLAHDDLVRHAELQRELRTPLCLDESVRDAASAASALALGSARMLNVKPGRLGGFHASLAVHSRCAAAGVPLLCGGMLESGIGRAYNVALASLPGFSEPGDLSPSARYWAQDIVTPAWTMDDVGLVQVPLVRPGLGVSVDTARIDDLTTRLESFRAR
ncbi:MAG: o-succinylbenzoic acid synthetase [Gemmatimonadetes bacterium]|jgi:O-succinylbenzoate synthase|nr:o-succinylbenzoic acid synthetase [Gemmatimonadota bacterium]